MPPVLSRLSLAAMLFASSSAVSAQVAPLVLQCKWESGGKSLYKWSTPATSLYKITPTSWSQWDASSWSWQDFECDYAPFENSGSRQSGTLRFEKTLSCPMMFNDNVVSWKIDGRSLFDNDNNEDGFVKFLSREISINRMSGQVMFSHLDYTEGTGKYASSSKREEDADRGMCGKVADPSLGRKPAPPPPPKPKF